MSISRRHFLTGVAAGVATAIAGPAVVRKVTRSVGATTYQLYPYQRDAIERIMATSRQMGKQAWAQLHMNEICRMRLDNIRIVMDAKD